jgi:ABC-type transporter Mla MlaB component
MFEAKIEDIGKSKILALYGELTIPNAELFKNALIDAMQNTDDFDLKLTGITDADLSCLQIVCSLHKNAINSNRSINIDDNSSEVFKKVLRDSGFLRQKGCLSDMPGRCLLTGENNE